MVQLAWWIFAKCKAKSFVFQIKNENFVTKTNNRFIAGRTAWATSYRRVQ
jgi:hypothetical protein